MFFGQSVRHLPPAETAPLQVPAAHLGEQNVQHKDDGDPRGHGAHLQRALIGAALEHHAGQGRAGGFGEPGNQNQLGLPLPGQPGDLQQAPGGAGSGRRSSS